MPFHPPHNNRWVHMLELVRAGEGVPVPLIEMGYPPPVQPEYHWPIPPQYWEQGPLEPMPPCVGCPPPMAAPGLWPDNAPVPWGGAWPHRRYGGQEPWPGMVFGPPMGPAMGAAASQAMSQMVAPEAARQHAVSLIEALQSGKPVTMTASDVAEVAKIQIEMERLQRNNADREQQLQAATDQLTALQAQVKESRSRWFWEIIVPILVAAVGAGFSIWMSQRLGAQAREATARERFEKERRAAEEEGPHALEREQKITERVLNG